MIKTGSAGSAVSDRPPGHASATFRPKVLIIIGTDPIGGPGKGLFQFLKYAPTSFEYILCNFDLKNRPEGQFVEEARRRNLNLLLLKQRATIDPSLILQARRVVLDHGINVIQTHGHKPSVIGWALRVLCGTPWIAFAHGYIDGNWKVRLYNWIDRTVVRHADRVIAVSGSMRALLITHGIPEEKIRLVYNAIEVSEVRPGTEDAEDVKQHLGISQNQKVVGVIGRLNPEKGQIVFLRAMAKAVATHPNVTALIVGEGQDRAMLEDYCRQHGLLDRVIFAGYRENVADYYQILDLLVLPSLSEGLPNTVLEAMSFGVPVLATNVGGVPEIIRDGEGVLIRPGDPDALADRMVELLENDSLRRTIGSRGRGSLHPRFAPDHRAQHILNVYEELLPAAGGQRRPGPHV